MATFSKTGSKWSQLLAALRQLDADERSGKVPKHRPVLLVKSLTSGEVAQRARVRTEEMIREARRLALHYSKSD